MDLTSIILAVITILGGCGWIWDRKRHTQEVAALRKDNAAKDMELAQSYVSEWKNNIAEPLQREVKGLRRDVKKLTHAIQQANNCEHADNCPVLDELQHKQDSTDGEQGAAD